MRGRVTLGLGALLIGACADGGYPSPVTTGGPGSQTSTPMMGMGSLGALPVSMGAGMVPFPQNRTTPRCAYPGNRDHAVVRTTWEKFKKTLVTANGAGNGLRVQRLENANDTVSEGIGYGMLAAVFMGEQAIFDGLWAYTRAHLNSTGLLHWRIDASGQVIGRGSASDADEDIAWALVMASRQWGGSEYLDAARAMIEKMWLFDVDHGRGEKLKAGDSWGSADVTFPSYFAPAYYRVFAQVTGQQGWLKVVDTSYELLAASGGAHGLAPEKITFEGAPVEAGYKYNSCRIPWRIAMDWCWYGEERARAYLLKTSTFFSGVGAGAIVDGYDLAGKPTSGNRKAMAFTGPAVVGAMVSDTFAPFLAAGWTRIFELVNDGYAWNYYQGSLGLLSLMTLAGDFTDLTTPE